MRRAAARTEFAPLTHSLPRPGVHPRTLRGRHEGLRRGGPVDGLRGRFRQDELRARECPDRKETADGADRRARENGSPARRPVIASTVAAVGGHDTESDTTESEY